MNHTDTLSEVGNINTVCFSGVVIGPEIGVKLARNSRVRCMGEAIAAGSRRGGSHEDKYRVALSLLISWRILHTVHQSQFITGFL